MKKITIPDMLAEFRRPSLRRAFIDVRSELEFAKAAIAGSTNLPLIYQSERHQIGIAYKESGQEAAIALGEKLVGPHQAERIAAWVASIQSSETHSGICMCWRGGLRSQIACEWLEANGQEVYQLEGGYKALRQALKLRLDEPPELLVIQGLTGAGKTEILRKLAGSRVDLEGAAHHRGSAFGLQPKAVQPSQSSFENEVAVQMLRELRAGLPLIIEDESRLIGKLCVPEPLLQAMRTAPVIVVRENRALRAARIYDEYFVQPAQQGQDSKLLEKMALDSFQQVAKRLDRLGPPIKKLMLEAFAHPTPEAHQAWIAALLEHYYDRRYEFAAERAKRKVLFEGDSKACLAWLTEQLSLGSLHVAQS